MEVATEFVRRPPGASHRNWYQETNVLPLSHATNAMNDSDDNRYVSCLTDSGKPMSFQILGAR